MYPPTAAVAGVKFPGHVGFGGYSQCPALPAPGLEDHRRGRHAPGLHRVAYACECKRPVAGVPVP